jgi:hypothetical protein
MHAASVREQRPAVILGKLLDDLDQPVHGLVVARIGHSQELEEGALDVLPRPLGVLLQLLAHRCERLKKPLLYLLRCRYPGVGHQADPPRRADDDADHPRRTL